MKYLINLNPDREHTGLDWRIIDQDRDHLVKSIQINVPSCTVTINGAYYISADGVLTVKDKEATINDLVLRSDNCPKSS